MNAGEFFWSGLALLFIGLQLVGAISWPWVYVLAPVWSPIASAALVAAGAWAYARWLR